MQDSQTASSKIGDYVASLKDIPTKETLLELLSNECIEVTFKKLNGDERVMTCTLKESYLPPAKKDDALSQTKIRNIEEKNIVVWDISANAWRSFRYDRISKVEQLK